MKRLFYFLAFSALILGSCSKASNIINNVSPSGNGFTINGDIFKNASINLISTSVDSFSTTRNATYLIVSGVISDTLNVNMAITFTGKTTLNNASFTSIASATPAFVAITLTPVTNPLATKGYICNVGALTVSAYGAVGTNITGTFSGTFTPNPVTSASGNVTITNGVFSAKRTE